MIDRPLVILAGGFGTRLRTVSNGLPKPLVDTNGKPFLLRLLQNWVNNGFNDFIFSLHYEANKIIDYLESQKPNFTGCTFRYTVEPIPMGTGGAVSFLLEKINIENSFFLTNADTWIDDGFLISNEVENNVIGVVEVDDVSRYGEVIVDDNGFVIEFLEKQKVYKKGLINAGIYKLNKNEFKNWDGHPFSLEKEFFFRLINEKRLVAKKIKSSFIDIGIPDDYFKFCKTLLD